jgi:hypothetical protein
VTPAKLVDDYLERLREALPAARSADVVAEVRSLIQDRLEAEQVAETDPAGVARALQSLGRPEELATALGGGSLTIDMATRRAYGRLLWIVYAAHLLISIVVTVVGKDTVLLPGLVQALPTHPFAATVLGAIGLFFLDAGLLGVLFVLFGRERAPAILPRLRLKMPGTRRDAAFSIVLLGLVAVLLNVPSIRDGIFAVGGQAGRAPILTPDALGLILVADVVLGLFLVRNVLLFAAGGESIPAIVVDALAALAGAVLGVLVMTRDALIAIPPSASLSSEQAAVFARLVYHVAVVIAFVSALLLAVRFVKRLMRAREILATR